MSKHPNFEQVIADIESGERYVDCYGLAIGPNECKRLAVAMNAPSAQVGVVNLTSRALGREGLSVLSQALERNMTVSKLVLDCIAPDTAPKKAKIQSHETIGDAAFSSLATSLRNNRSVRSISLEDNGLGDAAAASFADLLKHNPRIEVLNLADNHIGDAGALQLAEAIKTNTSLRVIDLSNNKIGDLGKDAIVEAIASTPHFAP